MNVVLKLTGGLIKETRKAEEEGTNEGLSRCIQLSLKSTDPKVTLVSSKVEVKTVGLSPGLHTQLHDHMLFFRKYIQLSLLSGLLLKRNLTRSQP